MDDILWTDDVIWSDNPYLWNHVVEITVTADIYGYVDMHRRQQRQYPSKKQLPKKNVKQEEEPEYIKLICVVDDERFEQINYINKKIHVEMLGGEFIVTDVKHMPNIKTEDVNWKITKNSNNEIKVTVSNIHMI